MDGVDGTLRVTTVRKRATSTSAKAPTALDMSTWNTLLNNPTVGPDIGATGVDQEQPSPSVTGKSCIEDLSLVYNR